MNKLILGLILALGLNTAQAERPFAKGEILVKFKDNSKVEQTLGKSGKIKKVFTGTKIHIISVPVNAEEKVRAALEKNPNVEIAELNILEEPAFIPNDPLRGNQWWLATIRAYDAMDVSTGSGVIVGVCDSAFNIHEDLDGTLLTGWDFYGEDHDLTSPNGHGIGVAGIIAANTNNGLGVAAPAYNVKIMPGKIGNDIDGNAYYSDMVQCAEYMADNGAKVINFSYGGVCAAVNAEAARYANSKGATVHWAAGNSNALLTCSNVEEQTVASATTSNNTKASFSNYGTAVDLAAPGSSVYSIYGTGYDRYLNLNGTSFSSPITAAAAAIVFANNPGITPNQVRNILYNTAVDLGNTDYYGNGLVDFTAAVNTEIPPGPICGNEILESGEECDDGNIINGDGCDSMCNIEVPPPEPDSQAPVINLKSPVENESYRRQIAIQGTAIDNVELAYIEIYINNSLKKRFNLSDVNSKKFNHREKMFKGTHTTTVKVVDTSNNITEKMVNFSIH